MQQKHALFDLLNGYFDNIYLITLKRSTDRHPRIRKTLSGLNYEIFWGVDGEQIEKENLEQQGIYSSKKAKHIKEKRNCEPAGLLPGMIGCSLSHNGIYKMMLERNEKKVLILEDDLLVDFSKTIFLKIALQELPPDWELFYLGYLHNNNRITFSVKWRIHLAYPLLHAAGFEGYNPRKLRCKYPRHYSEYLDRSGYHYGTHAYAVTDEGAKKILGMQTPIVREPDNALGHMCMNEMIQAFSVKEKVFHQNRKLKSTIRSN